MGLVKVMEMIMAHPDPTGLRVVQVLNLLGAIRMARAERRGEGIPYSKFAPSDSIKRGVFPSKTGMAILYSPAALLCSSFLLSKLSSPAPDHRLVVFSAALTMHYIKRLLEVFFVHKYSGTMEMSVSFTISLFYVLSSTQLLYAQNISVHQVPPSIDLMRLGMLLFVVGMGGNFYHHRLLANLRKDDKDKDGKKRYVTPQGGLFTWVVCPHYLFECIDFLGLALIGQTTSAFVVALATFIMLSARSRSTKQWYEKKIEGFPKERKAFLPFLF
ncbi:hypothetical protein L7F22_017715 [Adiantum nelumboides]|nr:hypothetical protein [Adiantum nelumboides]